MAAYNRHLDIGIDGRVLLASPHGGISEYTSRMIRELATIAPQHTFHVFLNAAKDDGRYVPPPSVLMHRFFYPNKIFNTAQRFIGYPRLDKLAGGMDVWWAPHFLPSSISCPSVLTIHDLSFLYYPEFLDIRRRLWHAFVSPELQAQKAAKIIAVSQSTSRDIEKHWRINSEDISVVYSGIGAEFHAGYNEEEKLKVRTAYNLPESFILTLGTVEPRKNILGTLRAFEEFRKSYPEHKAHLCIAGSPGWSSASLYRRIAQSPAASDIQCIGFVKQEDKAVLYNLASAFVYPSFFEGFGFPPLEAMACGVPTIVGNSSSLPEVVGDGAILVDPWRLEEIVFALKEIFSDKELVVDLHEKGIAQAKNFSWEKTAQATLAILEQTAGI